VRRRREGEGRGEQEGRKVMERGGEEMGGE
jgi:hypothetical protein